MLTLDEALRLEATTHDVALVVEVDVSDGADGLVARASVPDLATLRGARVGVERAAVGAFLLTRALQRAGLGHRRRLGGAAPSQRARGRRDTGTVDAGGDLLARAGAPGCPRRAPALLERELPGEIVDVLVIRASRANVASGAVRNPARLLFNLGKAAEAHPGLQTCLQQGAYRQQLELLFEASSRSRGLYSNPFAVSQMTSAQVSLSVYSPHFWQELPEECIAKWDAQAASNVVYAYGKLFSNGVAPAADERLRKLQVSIIAWHSLELAPQGVSNCSWSLAKQGLPFGDALVPLQEAAVRTSNHMDAQNVANTLWAFATMKLELGSAHEPLMNALERVTGEMSAQAVANTLWAFATMKLELSSRHEPLMNALERVTGEMNAQDVANTLWAFATMKLELGSANAPLMNALERVAGEMTAQAVANTLWAFATMKLELSSRHEPLMNALERVTGEMKAQEVSNTLWAFATMKLELGSANAPLMNALERVAGEMTAQAVANTLWAFATMKLELGSAHESLMNALERVAGEMVAQNVANSKCATDECA